VIFTHRLSVLRLLRWHSHVAGRGGNEWEVSWNATVEAGNIQGMDPKTLLKTGEAAWFQLQVRPSRFKADTIDTNIPQTIAASVHRVQISIQTHTDTPRTE